MTLRLETATETRAEPYTEPANGEQASRSIFSHRSPTDDIFVFACYTGLSYSDISKLNKNHLQKGIDKNEWIIIDRSKTNNRCRIPILPKAKEILESGKVKTIKEVAYSVGIKRPGYFSKLFKDNSASIN